jgi:translation initiation factor 2 subunit 3
MSGDDLPKKRHDESESEDDEAVEELPKLDIDFSKLNPLSPEVISKQVRLAMRKQQTEFLSIT